MPFKHACFISYRHHSQSLVAERFINELHTALTSELSLLTDKDIYLDRERLKGASFYNEHLATALCESVCMILVFTPTYFDRFHTYCAREYRAMMQLEQKRLRMLQERERKYGLIIPVILRGSYAVPMEITKVRQCYYFDNYTLIDRPLYEHQNYVGPIYEIAQYIADRCELFDRLPKDLCAKCKGFYLPQDDEIAPWLISLNDFKAPFPGRLEGL